MFDVIQYDVLRIVELILFVCLRQLVKAHLGG